MDNGKKWYAVEVHVQYKYKPKSLLEWLGIVHRQPKEWTQYDVFGPYYGTIEEVEVKALRRAMSSIEYFADWDNIKVTEFSDAHFVVAPAEEAFTLQALKRELPLSDLLQIISNAEGPVSEDAVKTLLSD